MIELVYKYNNTYCSIGKKPVAAVFSKEIELSHEAPKFKIGERVRITTYKSISTKGYTEHWLRKIFVINPVLKTNP